VSRIAGSILALGLLVTAGALQRVWTDPGSKPAELRAAVARLDAIPHEFGDWTSAPYELDPKQLEVGEIDGCFGRVYANRQTGQQFSVMIVCGRPGPIAVHTPDWCYTGLGFQLAGRITETAVAWAGPTSPAEFHDARFEKNKGDERVALRILWSWSALGQWESPSNTRMAYAGHPYLYKLYVVQDVTPQRQSSAGVDAVMFCRELIDVVTPVLFAAGPMAGPEVGG
jgi:hypothetical protein